MRFLYLIFFLILLGCGPSEKEKQILEEEVTSIKNEMTGLLQESNELSTKFSKYKMQESNIEAAEERLKSIRTELENSASDSKEYLDLKANEAAWAAGIEKEKKILLTMGDHDEMDKQLQFYTKKYDSLSVLLNEKIRRLKE